MWCASVLKKEDALPRPEPHFSAHNRHGLAGARQSHADVRWHVVAAFCIMRKVIGVFRHETLEKLLQIASGGRIGVFHDDDAATGVLNENGDCSVLGAALVYRRLHVIGDFIECLAVGAHFELVMADVHFQEMLFGVMGRAKQRATACTAGKE
jgi:hypothetical protein